VTSLSDSLQRPINLTFKESVVIAAGHIDPRASALQGCGGIAVALGGNARDSEDRKHPGTGAA
jgi:hypothetical protein